MAEKGSHCGFQTRHTDMRKRRMIPVDQLVEHCCVGYDDFPIVQREMLKIGHMNDWCRTGRALAGFIARLGMYRRFGSVR
jgi:hypothetical protein